MKRIDRGSDGRSGQTNIGHCSRILRNHPGKCRKFAEIRDWIFIPRAAIWPLTLGPLLAIWELRGTCPYVFEEKRPRSSSTVPSPLGLPVKRPRMPGHVRISRETGRSRVILRGSVRRGLSQKSAHSSRTYVPSCRLIFRLKSHIRQNISASPSRSYALRNATALQPSLRDTLGVVQLRRTRRKHQSSNKKFLVRTSSVKPNPTRLTNVTSR